MTVNRQLLWEALLTEAFQALKVIDATVIRFLTEKGCKALHRGAICNVAASKDARVSLSYVLRPLHVSI